MSGQFLGVVCLHGGESFLSPPLHTAGGTETQINYSESENAKEQEVLSAHSTNQSVLMTWVHLVLEGRRKSSRGRELEYLLSVTSPSELIRSDQNGWSLAT